LTVINVFVESNFLSHLPYKELEVSLFLTSLTLQHQRIKF
jgi:hypothetical protein